MIEQNSIVSATEIGNNVHIGKSCIIGSQVVINDNAKILDNSIVPPHVVIPQNTVYGGKPARYIAELPESAGQIHKEIVKNFNLMFIEKRGAPQSSG